MTTHYLLSYALILLASTFSLHFQAHAAPAGPLIKHLSSLIKWTRTYLKSKYLGTLPFATGFDGDGALFPLAFGVVDEENDDNWTWFLTELHNLLEVNTENMPRLTILSDRQQGIVDGVEACFPTAFHGFCMRHLSDSFRKILEIEEVSQDVAFWIRRVPPRLWATAYFEGHRFGHLTANIDEAIPGSGLARSDIHDIGL
ncbi:hypothetical protein KIW84_012711 [Lathyrus oleraceus]|uniref:MULE transposase domain-containing protein n=1 Tax=Pisum sativum TaxID=3888 RepID=A0A9D5BIB4_PEA|nr:hypothetical protein KIW84_012709 [Pisum sativum]KAI5444188.1 hypothetical protein KIW84_012711 [Pisum sativum]